MKKYIIDFPMDGGQYSTLIEAESWADAEKRLEAIRNHGLVIGEHVATIPAIGGAWFPALVCRVRNVFAR